MSLQDLDIDLEPIYYTTPALSSRARRIFHGFFTRRGGLSTDIYASLNCGMGSEDEVAQVRENRKVVAGLAGVGVQDLMCVHQVHGDECVVLGEAWSESKKPQADALVTDRAGLALGIMTADCAPVLFYGEKDDGAPVIGAAHAGWGGALKGVLRRTVEAMVGLGANIETVHASIGPCIGQSSYEVSEDFLVPFIAQDEGNERFFKSGQRQGHYMFDLAGYCASRLAEAGVRDVMIKDLDTYFNEEDFYSYRRATHRGEVDYGRQISVVAIKENKSR